MKLAISSVKPPRLLPGLALLPTRVVAWLSGLDWAELRSMLAGHAMLATASTTQGVASLTQQLRGVRAPTSREMRFYAALAERQLRQLVHDGRRFVQELDQRPLKNALVAVAAHASQLAQDARPAAQGARKHLAIGLRRAGRHMPGPPVEELRSRIALGLGLILFLIFGMGGWMATAQLSSAVIASGLIVVDSNVKKVQHPTGGVVGAILVKDGDKVAPHDLLVRLDETQTRAALGIIVSQLVELQGRKARLVAERDDLAELSFPEDFEAEGEEAERVMAGERRLFESRRAVTEGQKAQLRERIGQLRQEIVGLTAQRDAKAKELTLVREEYGRVDDMHKRGLLPVTRVLAMQREETRISGEHGSFVAQVARTTGQIAETELNVLSIDQNRRTDAQKELRETEGRIAELSERRLAAEDQLKRIDIRSPQAGIVHDLNVHTVGGVIAAGEPIMQIVPTGDLLAIEIRIAPRDIDQVALGQKATLRFTAFNQRTTPEVSGVLTRIAADLTHEAQTNASFYVARVKPDEESLAGLGNVKLVPGMPVEAFIETGKRTALSYFLKPVSDQLARTFRER